MFVAPTITDSGDLIYPKRIGYARSFGGSFGREREWISQDNTVYLVTIANQVATNNYYNFELNYYVHPGA